jgi:hypothetical protein
MVLERAARKEWLVQRMEKPIGGFPSVFSFGGGRVNGGFTENAMAVLRSIVSFDYMGSAEFEWGSVPTAFRDLANSNDEGTLTSFTMTFDPNKCSKYYDSSRTGKRNTKPVKVYVICSKKELGKIKEFLTKLAETEMYLDTYNKERLCLKEFTYFAAVLRFPDQFKTVAWIELGYPAFWTVDKTIFNRMKDAYGLQKHQKGTRPDVAAP